MSNRNWTVLAIVLIFATVLMVAFAANNPRVQNSVSNANQRGLGATSQPLNQETNETVVLDSEETAEPTMSPVPNNNDDDDSTTIVVPGLQQVLPSQDPRMNATASPSPSATPSETERD